jgi:hypothetical protein
MKLSRSLPDLWAIALLACLWILFFWRLWTPFHADQLSFSEGDFSYQFVAWTDYAVERLQAGQIPLWNPYIYGGAPFQASSQTALTYPPRLLTLATLLIQDEVQPWEVYQALQREVTLHVLAASLLVYGFVRALIRQGQSPEVQAQTGGFPAPILGGLVAGIAYAYGGYLGGYPILQAPLLEAGIWLPAALWAILHATDGPSLRWRWIHLGGVVIGVSLLAGHPQTSLFLIYTALAFLAYRLRGAGWGWRKWLAVSLWMGVLAGGLAAVQLLPTAEFSAHTYRTDLTFAAKGGGYSFEELSNLLFPLRGQLWNSNYSGVVVMLLAGVALWRRVTGAAFWGGLLLLAALLTFGARTPLYGALYLLLPGLSLFRGQERAMFIIAQCGAILAGLGAAHLLTWGSWRERPHLKSLQRVLLGLLTFSAGVTLILYLLAQTDLRTQTIVGRMDGGVISVFMLVVLWVGLGWFLSAPHKMNRHLALLVVLTFDLFSTTAMLAQNYQPVPVDERLMPMPFHSVLQSGLTQPGARADTMEILEGGYNLPWRWLDIGGSDPLQLEASQYYLEQTSIERRWELLAVQVVITAKDSVPVLAQSIGGGVVPFSPFTIWQLQDPRPFALTVYGRTIAPDSASARAMLNEPTLNLRQTVILSEPTFTPAAPMTPTPARLTHFAPEHLIIEAQAEQSGILTLAMLHFPGWEAWVNGQPTPILTTYGGLMGLELPQAGDYRIELRYESRWLWVGGAISALAWIGVLLGWLGWFFSARRPPLASMENQA